MGNAEPGMGQVELKQHWNGIQPLQGHREMLNTSLVYFLS